MCGKVLKVSMLQPLATYILKRRWPKQLHRYIWLTIYSYNQCNDTVAHAFLHMFLDSRFHVPKVDKSILEIHLNFYRILICGKIVILCFTFHRAQRANRIMRTSCWEQNEHTRMMMAQMLEIVEVVFHVFIMKCSFC